MAMMAMTQSNSISVNALNRCGLPLRFMVRKPDSIKDAEWFFGLNALEGAARKRDLHALCVKSTEGARASFNLVASHSPLKAASIRP